MVAVGYMVGVVNKKKVFSLRTFFIRSSPRVTDLPIYLPCSNKIFHPRRFFITALKVPVTKFQDSGQVFFICATCFTKVDMTASTQKCLVDQLLKIC